MLDFDGGGAFTSFELIFRLGFFGVFGYARVSLYFGRKIGRGWNGRMELFLCIGNFWQIVMVRIVLLYMLYLVWILDFDEKTISRNLSLELFAER